MKITIDTKEDSADDIRRVVKMLQAWTEGHSNAAPFNNLFSDSSEPKSGDSDSGPAVNEGLFNLFNDDKKDDDSDSDTPQIINLDQSDDSGDVPPVITY